MLVLENRLVVLGWVVVVKSEFAGNGFEFDLLKFVVVVLFNERVL